MKTSNKTIVSFSIFITFGMIFLILLSETTALNQLSVFQELKKEELEWGKNILEQCDLPHEKYSEMKETLFNVEQELLNNNPNNAAKYFNLIRPTLGTCVFELSGKPHPVEIMLGQSVLILGGISAGITLGLFIRDNIKPKLSTKKE